MVSTNRAAHRAPARRRRAPAHVVLAACCIALLGTAWPFQPGFHHAPARVAAHANASAQGSRSRSNKPHTTGEKIVAGARAQLGTLYDPAYRAIPYPNGDVPRGADGIARGVCTDVVIRALRAAGHDLQRLIHQDMKRNFRLYPRQWDLRRPDHNIDHRRVPNQMTFFRRRGQTLTREVSPRTRARWRPGDTVCWKFDNGLDHTGIVSDKTSARGWPLVIHNLSVCAEEDALTAWRITGHFRYPKRG